MPQGPADGTAILPGHPFEAAVETGDQAAHRPALRIGLGVGIVPDAGQHRVEREGDEERDQDGGGNGDAEFVEKPADNAVHEGDRQEDCHDCRRCCDYRKPDFIGAVEGRAQMRFTHVKMAGDVFAHHDGVIHQNADGKRQRQQAERIEREAEEMYHRERADDCDWQCQPGNNRAAPGV